MNYSLSYNCWLMLTLVGKYENVQKPVCPSSTTKGLLNSSEKVWSKYVSWSFGWFVFLKQCFALFPFLPPSTAPHFILSINYIQWKETGMKCEQNFTFSKPANHNLLLCKNSNLFCKTPGIYGSMPKSFLGPVLTNSLHSNQLELESRWDGIWANTMQWSILIARQEPSFLICFHKLRGLKSGVVLLP